MSSLIDIKPRDGAGVGTMPTLLIEHSIRDFDPWHEAFGRFAARREEGGVVRERIMQPIGDPHYVLIDLEFATVEAAQRFQQFLKTQVVETRPTRPPSRAAHGHASWTRLQRPSANRAPASRRHPRTCVDRH